MGNTKILTKTNAQNVLAKIDNAIMKASAIRANFGAIQNRIQTTISNLQNSVENLSAANSRIRDADMAEEASEFTRNNILLQAGVGVLSQANQISNSALSILNKTFG